MRLAITTIIGSILLVGVALRNPADEKPSCCQDIQEQASCCQQPAPYAAEMNRKFADPNADIQPFVQRFENEGRDVFVKRQDIIKALDLQPGETVADVGAGTGVFTLLFAEAVKPHGKVFAVDIGPAMLKHVAERAKECGCEPVITTVLNTHDSTELPAACADLVFVCDTYHHFEHPERMLASIHRALRPGGRLVVIDFDLYEGCSEFVRLRARAPKEVYFQEIASAGFEPVRRTEIPDIKDHFYAEFRRTDTEPALQAVSAESAHPTSHDEID